MHLTAIFIDFNKAFFLVLLSSCKSVSINRKDSEDVPNIPIALMERLTMEVINGRVVFSSLTITIYFYT